MVIEKDALTGWSSVRTRMWVLLIIGEPLPLILFFPFLGRSSYLPYPQSSFIRRHRNIYIKSRSNKRFSIPSLYSSIPRSTRWKAL